MSQVAIENFQLSQKIKKLSLGQSYSQVYKYLGTPNRITEKQGYKIMSYAWGADGTHVFANYFFEQDQLVGYISGFNPEPQTVIEQTK